MAKRREKTVGVPLVALLMLAGAFAAHASEWPYFDAVTLKLWYRGDHKSAPWINSKPAARGEADARRDLRHGVRQVVIYGYLVNVEQIDERWRAFGYNWQPGGCIIGDIDYSYWSGYNRVMLEAGRKQFGKRFAGVAQRFLLAQ